MASSKDFIEFDREGYCPICEGSVRFHAYSDWLRDFFVCTSCGSIPRERAVAYVLKSIRPDYRGLVVHECSPSWRALSQQLRERCPNYIPSQFWPDKPLGEPYLEFRNENLERLTFGDASIDIHLSQDVLEHVFDIDRAFSEIARTLKSGGLHIFTTPLVNKFNPTFRRADQTSAGETVYLAEPTYHQNPISQSGSLVVHDFGFDIASRILAVSGLATVIYSFCDESKGLLGEYLEVCASLKA